MLLDNDVLACYSAPANVLLFGEYAVLERNGLGIAAAVAPRVTATISPAAKFSVVGLASGKEIKIDTEMLIADDPEARFLCGLTRFLIANLYPHRNRMRKTLKLLSYCITIDARACYDVDGRKIGLGSSAASTVCLTAALAHLRGSHSRSKWSALLRSGALSSADSMTNAQHSTATASGGIPIWQRVFRERVFRLALRAHRHIRGGGSGYDVAASSFGGFTLFRGGRRPRISFRSPPWSKSGLRLLRGTQAVDSKKAVTHYQQWKQTHRQEWREFVRGSNHIAQLMIRVQTEQEVIQAINLSRELQLSLGERIGVTATFPLPANSMTDYPRIAYRTVGAGNELAVVFGATDAIESGANKGSGEIAEPAHGELLSIENDGVRWEQ